MKKKLYKLWQETVIFYLGGMFYCGVELLWRGWTHGSMFLLARCVFIWWAVWTGIGIFRCCFRCSSAR